MVAGLTSLGARVETVPDVLGTGRELVIEPGPLRGGQTIDVGLAGTVMRFLAPVAALADGRTRFVGDPAAAKRPIRPLLEALNQLGVTTTSQDGTLEVDRPAKQNSESGEPRPDQPGPARPRPKNAAQLFTVDGRGGLGGVSGRQVWLDAKQSSQFLSALLLSAPRFNNGLEVSLRPEILPSRPHVEMTLAALSAFGASHNQTGRFSWTVNPGGLTGGEITVEPDLSNAAPFLAAAVVSGGQTQINGWPAVTTQAGQLMLEYLRAFGAQVDLKDGCLTVTGQRYINGVQLDLTPAGELTPVVAALATLADEDSRLDGIGHLRGHETDRLAALATEIRRLGGKAQAGQDYLTIQPSELHGGLVRSYGDHRMATFGAVIGLRVPGVEIEDINVTTKTFPGFAAEWTAML
jgi:3-phosphoshikimate 1-carboxyvinyltransferase